jgi:tetratricopeptide (TPR) repeat protein
MRLKITIVLLFFAALVKADSYLDSLFLKGNTHYFEEQYADAIDSYNQILDSNHISFELYYNLGNSYFQFGKIPKSILYFEKALLLDKGNKSCLNNLELARNRIEMIEPIPRLFYVNWWNLFSSSLNLNWWSVLLIISVWSICILIVLFTRNRKKWIFNAMISSIILCLIFAFAMVSANNKQNKVSGIIMTDSKLYSSSSLKSDIGLVKAGNKAIVKEIFTTTENNDVVFIHLEDGQTAYIKTSEIRLIK